ncbi:MAG: DUF4445 domain-containing protein [Synergistaceae bacterium]|nr:DUF4445 domain-containing protein [Synergistaceae bacterium]
MVEPLHTILFQPDGVSADVTTGTTVMDAASKVGVKINRHCGGVGVCGKCRISAIKGGEFLNPITPTETKRLKSEEIASGVRLSCCAKVEGSGTVHVIDMVGETGNQILEGTSDKIISHWAPDRVGLGVAVDIGTTTVVCYLLDLDGHNVLGSRSFLNPQVSYGDDVISRIAACTSQPGALQRMQESLVKEMDKAFSYLAENVGATKERINEVVVAGNTVMEHIFLGISPESIGHSPYSPQFQTHPPVPSAELGFHIAKDGIVKVLPNVAGYVGADIVAGIAAHSVDKELTMRLLVDIGTNNELVIGNSDRMYCCATAAGPAFEGARINQGMRASMGAIEKVKMTNDGISYKVIGNVVPVGLCGSGLIDVTAMMIKEGLVDGRGKMQTKEECTDERFRERLSLDENRINRLLITDTESPVYITQKDIREVQLAIGAVKVGTEVMMEQIGITVDGIDEILLAGAFGSNINVESAIIVGLLPKVEREKVRFIFNSSGLGACMALASADFYRETEWTMSRMEYIELSSLQDFQKRFIKSMLFF